eukprot:3295782-Alexandrium_andersonii.AAC.1
MRSGGPSSRAISRRASRFLPTRPFSNRRPSKSSECRLRSSPLSARHIKGLGSQSRTLPMSSRRTRAARRATPGAIWSSPCSS